jgi:hypothetical protein
LVLVGCSKIKEAGKMVGIENVSITPSVVETAEERAAKEKAEQERIEKEKQDAITRLKNGDILVQQWTDKLADKQPNGGFLHHEGLLDADPWGNMIKVEYSQKWFEEIMVVTSAGPDGKFGTQDDLSRTRIVPNPGGILDGISKTGWAVILWAVLGSVALSIAYGARKCRKVQGMAARRRHPVTFAIVMIILGPISFAFYVTKMLTSFFGGAVGHPEWGIDLDFDLDLDIDI